MRKTTSYSPCDETGSLGAPVGSDQDFKDFCVFMHDQSDSGRARRKLAYEKLSADGVASSASKIEFVRLQSLDYIKNKLRAGNSLSAQALSNDATKEDERLAQATLSAMGSQFRGLISAVGKDVFEGLMLGAKMTDAAREALTEALWAGSEFAKNIIHTALKAESGKAAQALSAWRETAQARRELTSKVAQERGEDGIKLDPKYGIYQPLIKYLSDHVVPSERAEFLARFEDYANSGWLDRDLGLGPADDVRATEASAKWGAIAARIISGETPAPDPQTVVDALYPRLAEVSLKIKTEQKGGSRVEISPMTAEDIQTLAPSGVVDCFTLTDTGGAIVTFASSDALLGSQNDQWARHLLAVEEAVAELNLSSVSYRVCAPCLVADETVGKAARKVGSVVEEWFGGGAAVSAEIRGLINVMPFINALASGAETVIQSAQSSEATIKLPGEGLGAFAERLDFTLIGSSCNAWSAQRARLSDARDKDVELSVIMLETVSKLMGAFVGAAQRKGPDGALLKGVPSMDQGGPTMSLFLNLTQSVAKHVAPQTPDPRLTRALSECVESVSKARSLVEDKSEAYKTLFAARSLFKGLLSDIQEMHPPSDFDPQEPEELDSKKSGKKTKGSKKGAASR